MKILLYVGLGIYFVFFIALCVVSILKLLNDD